MEQAYATIPQLSRELGLPASYLKELLVNGGARFLDLGKGRGRGFRWLRRDVDRLLNGAMRRMKC